MRINPDQLVAFSAVADLGSVSRAAEHLNLSQPTVSSQLRALQDQVGEPLYRRRAHGVQLTPAGERLLPYAQTVARALRQASDHIAGVQARPARVMKVGLSYTLGRRSYGLIRQAQAQGLALHLHSGDSATLASLLLAGELDAALVLGPLNVPTDRLDLHAVGEDELVLALPRRHRLAEAGYTPLGALGGETMLWAARSSSVRRHAERLLEGAGLTLPRLELGSLYAVREALLDGHGVAILPREFVARERELGLLATAGIEAPFVTISCLLLTPPVGTQGPEERALTDFLLGHHADAGHTP